MPIRPFDPLSYVRAARQMVGRLKLSKLLPPKPGGDECSEEKPGSFWKFMNSQRDVDFTTRLPLDIYHTDDEVIVVACLSGVTAETLKITLVGERLTITGVRKPRVPNVSYLMMELPHGPFERTLILEGPIDRKRAEAHFDSGVLRIILPKMKIPESTMLHLPLI